MQINKKGYLGVVSIFTLILALVLVDLLNMGWLWRVLIVLLLSVGELCLYLPRKIFRSEVDDGLAVVFHLIFLILSWLVFMLVGSELMYKQQNLAGIFYVPSLALVVVVGRVRVLGLFMEAK